jgi:hypothetical protein
MADGVRERLWLIDELAPDRTSTRRVEGQRL